MPHRFRFQREGRLLAVVFEGTIDIDEERQAILDVAGSPDFNPEADIIVDRTRARMLAGPEEVLPQIDLARESFAPRSKPKLAIVASTDYEFAMSRMLELRSLDQLPHQYRVFREIEDACKWLALASSEVEWP